MIFIGESRSMCVQLYLCGQHTSRHALPMCIVYLVTTSIRSLTQSINQKGERIISQRRRSQVWHHTCDSHSMTSPAPHTHDVHMTKSRESHPHENIQKTIRSQGT